jgi:hypothetical protein
MMNQRRQPGLSSALIWRPIDLRSRRLTAYFGSSVAALLIYSAGQNSAIHYQDGAGYE